MFVLVGSKLSRLSAVMGSALMALPPSPLTPSKCFCFQFSGIISAPFLLYLFWSTFFDPIITETCLYYNLRTYQFYRQLI